MTIHSITEKGKEVRFFYDTDSQEVLFVFYDILSLINVNIEDFEEYEIFLMTQSDKLGDSLPFFSIVGISYLLGRLRIDKEVCKHILTDFIDNVHDKLYADNKIYQIENDMTDMLNIYTHERIADKCLSDAYSHLEQAKSLYGMIRNEKEFDNIDLVANENNVHLNEDDKKIIFDTCIQHCLSTNTKFEVHNNVFYSNKDTILTVLKALSYV